jgi:hypothetical protein
MSFYTSEKMLIKITSLIKDAEEFYSHIFMTKEKIQAEIIKDIKEELNVDYEDAKYVYDLIKNNVT